MEKIDRSKWRRGPWDAEPDRVEWRREGRWCVVQRGGEADNYTLFSHFEIKPSDCLREIHPTASEDMAIPTWSIWHGSRHGPTSRRLIREARERYVTLSRATCEVHISIAYFRPNLPPLRGHTNLPRPDGGVSVLDGSIVRSRELGLLGGDVARLLKVWVRTGDPITLGAAADAIEENPECVEDRTALTPEVLAEVASHWRDTAMEQMEKSVKLNELVTSFL